MATDQQIPADTDLLARGGGNATASGVSFQAALGAVFASQLLTDRRPDERLRMGEARIRSLRFETEAPLDDILVETDLAGWIFSQVKTNLSLSEDLDSEFGKTVAQIARQWRTCAIGKGERGWDRSLVPGRDRMLIAVGPQASGTITRDLATALATMQAPSAAPLPQAQQQALDKARALLAQAWEQIVGATPSAQDIDTILHFVTVIQFNLDGPDRVAAIETLTHVTENGDAASAAFAAIERQCEGLMAKRRGTDAADLRQALASIGVRLRAAQRYQPDVQRLRVYSARVQTHLNQYEETKVGDVLIKVRRDCTAEAVAAARTESLVLVGEPGAGKSAVVSAAAEQLRSEGSEVIELAVDRLLVESLDGLRIALELEHGLREVLENWPGSEPAFLFIDALDATRGGKSEAIFRALIADVLDMPGARWRVVASIRTFDLRLGEQFKRLFEGTPPSDKYIDPAFSKVRHIHVPRWSDEELAEVLARAPAIAIAIERAGDRLRDLARVPFNTRLLAELIGGGLSADAFGDVRLQVQLLALYWHHRVERYGTGADLCLRAAVAQMVANRHLQANRLDVAASDPTAFDNLRSSNVLIAVSGDRYVSFRHHILFDYAASRVFIDPADVAATGNLLRRDRGLGLMLAPALSYALQDLWVSGQAGHPEFWRAITHFAGDSASDPIARSVAARSACELPVTPDDMRGFTSLFSGPPAEQALAFRAFSHVVGALTVRIEDGLAVQLSPWCYLASKAGAYVMELAWPLRTLLYLLVERVKAREQIMLLGQVARQLLQHALGQSDQWSQLASASIGFVADTYESDPAASRRALERLLTPGRLRSHAHEDMPWLARKVLKIAASDPGFVPHIYETVFSYGVTDDGATSIGASQILPLRSNRRQDYEMAKWTLKEAFPRFLQEHSIEGVCALIGALEGHVSYEHSLDEAAEEIAIQVGTRTGKLIDDRSHIWAWNPDDAHSDNAVSLVRAFSSRLSDAPENDALQIANEAINRNRLAILWSRMFKAGAARPKSLGSLLWPFAIQLPFLVSHDTSKDAIDLIAARYPAETAPVREIFERGLMAVQFPRAREPERAKQHFLLRIFRTIGSEHLATPDAQQLVKNAPPTEREASNPRLFEVISMEGDDGDPHWWLRQEGVDLDSSSNVELLAQVDEITAQLGLNVQAELSGDLGDAASRLKALWKSALAADTAGAAANVVDHAKDIVARGCTRLARNADALRQRPELLNAACDLIEALLVDTSPQMTDDAEARDESSLIATRGVRVDGAEAAMHICKLDAATAARFRPSVERLARDAHPAVRLAVVSRLTMLWDTARDLMWELAELYGNSEGNLRVLRFFADFLVRVIHVDPARVETLIFTVLSHVVGRTEQRAGEELIEAIGSLMVILWVTHERTRAHATLEEWMSNPATHEPEIGHAIHSIRDGLVVGYGTPDTKDGAIRGRCQQFAARVVEVTATGMQSYFDIPPNARTDADNESATKLAKLLDETVSQYYFASGTFREGKENEDSPLRDDALKSEFLDDNYDMFRRIGDVGTPHTIYQLIEMLGYLVPADPARVFDLVAHALLTAGRKQGFQFESLGAERFVEVVGLFMADHREIFEDSGRRDQLVACLEVFVDIGWPAARRLLYRLPELLQ